MTLPMRALPVASLLRLALERPHSTRTYGRGARREMTALNTNQDREGQ